MVEFKISDSSDMDTLIGIRLEMLRIVNDLSDDYQYPSSFVEQTRKYFEEGNQTTVLAFDGNKAVGCATLSYINIMPTFDHPTGNRAHLMNVYTNRDHRRQGIAAKMVSILIDEAKEKGVTEISLDATQMGKPLYESLGFSLNDAGMVLELR
ncbi:GNAT family N-acetyltransferase [Treponema sp.]|uniref:GNAT family N-acetyltransferase n=1 Tax=Treponema sp. TaxID=166 RepID=UPI00298EAAD0|nr:GNAT family N-acetyltransferase [Treponema sp.]MCQ2241640.1 GNAT family N-acetyltransferase [Treponema sp.]